MKDVRQRSYSKNQNIQQLQSSHSHHLGPGMMSRPGLNSSMMPNNSGSKILSGQKINITDSQMSMTSNG